MDNESPRSSYKAVLFDMDGVITDSMPYHYEAWKHIFATCGISVTKNEIFVREGEKGEVTLRAILSSHGKYLSDEAIKHLLSEKERIFRAIASPRLFTGAKECIETIHNRGKKLALVTGTSGTELRSNVPASLLSLFDAIVSGDMVSRGKPDPEPYLMALAHLGVQAHEAVVIENAPYGIRSAKAAGLYCIALTTSLPRSYLKDADLILETIHDVRKVLCDSA